MITEKYLKNIVILEFDDRKDLTETFMRIQEYYEGRAMKGRLDLTHAEVRSFYERNGGDYVDYSTGFNVPGGAIREFLWPDIPEGVIPLHPIQAIRRDASIYETLLAREFKPNSYYIGVLKGQQLVLEHELSHALYYTDAEYRRCCREAVTNEAPLGAVLDPIYNAFEAYGYHSSVVEDEFIAYTLEDDLLSLLPDLPEEELCTLRVALRPLHNELTVHFMAALDRIGGL